MKKALVTGAKSGKEIPLVIKRREGRKLEVKKQYLSLVKAEKNFHWQAKTSLTEGLRRTFIWYKEYFK